MKIAMNPVVIRRFGISIALAVLGTGILFAGIAMIADSPPAGGPIVRISANGRDIALSWDAVNGADYYQLLENPDSEQDRFSPVGFGLSGTDTTRDIPWFNRLHASYIVQACNQAGCVDSGRVKPVGHPAIRELTMPNADMQDIPRFGNSIAISGDGNTLAVAATREPDNGSGLSGNDGAVYLYVRSAAGSWAMQQKIAGPKPDSTGWFVNSVALSRNGDTLAIGVAGNSPSVYVYARKGKGWVQQARLKGSNAETRDQFGASIALSAEGTTLAVGAPGDSGDGTGINPRENSKRLVNAGAAYVFTRDGEIWTEQAYVKSSNTDWNDFFGTSVALSGTGNTLAVGAGTEPGAVFVFDCIDGNWEQQAYLNASDKNVSDQFGSSVSLSYNGDTLAVGAFYKNHVNPGNESGTLDHAGAVYIFDRVGARDNWVESRKLIAPHPGAEDFFGSSVALSIGGDSLVLAVGAPREDSNAAGINGDSLDDSAVDAGAAFVFSRNGSNWTQRAYVKAPSAAAGAGFGTSVALAFDGTLAVGAPLRDESSGSVFLYENPGPATTSRNP